MTSEALTTKARIKSRLAITVSSFDTLIDNFILAASARIQQMTGRNFLQATYTSELYDGSDIYGTGRCNLVVKNAPILAITSVQYKSGSNSSPTWTSYDEDDYDIDMDAGVLYFTGNLPRGKRNIRITYTAGFSGYAIGLSNIWTYNVIPTGAINGVNRTYTLPETASQIIVYSDGLRISASNYSFTADTDTFTMNVGSEAYSTLVVDYANASVASDDPTLPADIVEACEQTVVRMFKRRESDGRTSETLGESTITWTDSIFNKENLATIKNYRRTSFL